jgi:hypothetical protein
LKVFPGEFLARQGLQVLKATHLLADPKKRGAKPHSLRGHYRKFEDGANLCFCGPAIPGRPQPQSPMRLFRQISDCQIRHGPTSGIIMPSLTKNCNH